jgi:hypothetical protein
VLFPAHSPAPGVKRQAATRTAPVRRSLVSALWLGSSEGPPPDAQDLIDALRTPPWAPLVARLRRLGRPERRRPAEVTPACQLRSPAAEEAA